MRVIITSLVLSVFCVAGCEDPPRGGGPDDSPGVRGPEGGILRFDAAMIERERDGGPTPRLDGGPPPRLDAGPPRPRDSGPSTRDAGPRCSGSATPCSLLPTFDCSSALGCSLGGDCSGSARSCYSISYSTACDRQDGCYWSFSSDDCSGSARSCYGYTSSSSCTRQDGCFWDDDCEGTVRSCSEISTTFCEDQPGCHLTWD